jgi:hypothetical protein
VEHTAEHPDAEVIDLADRTTVRLRRDDTPLAQMSAADRRRIIIRVLCELVAYGEPAEAARQAS